jgi:hypothetical protein
MSEDVTEADLDRVDKSLLFILGNFRKLIRMGLIEAGANAPLISDRGMALYEEIKASGFDPTPEEIRYGVEMFRADPPDVRLLNESAPDLLAVCEKAFEWLRYDSLTETIPDTVYFERREILLAAIQKAKGATS